jgi:hypothetical protein
MAIPVQGTDEVRSTDGREPVPEPVGTPTESQLPEANEAQNPTDTERVTTPLSLQSSPVSTAARQLSATQPVWDRREEILALLGTAMERPVKAWSGREEAQTSATTEAEVMTWKKRLANCEEALKQKVELLTEAEKGQAELR